MRWLLPILLLVAITALAGSAKKEKVNAGGPGDNRTPFFTEKLKQLLLEKKAAQFVLGSTRQGRSVEAYYFPGTSDLNAIVVGGVHGSELSSIAITGELIRQLQEGQQIFYNVIVIPCLFPDNAARAILFANEIGSEKNIGRYSFARAADPNRQMPTPGHCLDELHQKDHTGRLIENENSWFLQLIQAFKPQRIASVHAIRNRDYAGFFADPRTDEKSMALGYETDSSLSVMMAKTAEEMGGQAPGNRVNGRPNALYYKDPAPVARGLFQKRNFNGSAPGAGRGTGISLGSWATTAVKDPANPGNDRNAIRVITIEFPGSKRPGDYPDPLRQRHCNHSVQAYAGAIRQVFLGNYFTEE
ncbi:MAG TPA: hypothetical protein VFX58_20250 [Chitinophagaceae bacterium]|nr:hypothetical protein [Chitinophagaceae bacterium]